MGCVFGKQDFDIPHSWLIETMMLNKDVKEAENDLDVKLHYAKIMFDSFAKARLGIDTAFYPNPFPYNRIEAIATYSLLVQSTNWFGGYDCSADGIRLVWMSYNDCVALKKAERATAYS